MVGCANRAIDIEASEAMGTCERIVCYLEVTSREKIDAKVGSRSRAEGRDSEVQGLTRR